MRKKTLLKKIAVAESKISSYNPQDFRNEKSYKRAVTITSHCLKRLENMLESMENKEMVAG
jgi:hypothetical protein